MGFGCVPLVDGGCSLCSGPGLLPLGLGLRLQVLRGQGDLMVRLVQVGGLGGERDVVLVGGVLVPVPVPSCDSSTTRHRGVSPAVKVLHQVSCMAGRQCSQMYCAEAGAAPRQS